MDSQMPNRAGLVSRKFPLGGLPYDRYGDARRQFWIKPLKETNLGATQALLFSPLKYSILKKTDKFTEDGASENLQSVRVYYISFNALRIHEITKTSWLGLVTVYTIYAFYPSRASISGTQAYQFSRSTFSEGPSTGEILTRYGWNLVQQSHLHWSVYGIMTVTAGNVVLLVMKTWFGRKNRTCVEKWTMASPCRNDNDLGNNAVIHEELLWDAAKRLPKSTSQHPKLGSITVNPLSHSDCRAREIGKDGQCVYNNLNELIPSSKTFLDWNNNDENSVRCIFCPRYRWVWSWFAVLTVSRIITIM